MKPAPFDYFAPTTVDEVRDLLARYGDDAKILAGGQSLVPVMALRLSQPSVVIDINRYNSNYPSMGMLVRSYMVRSIFSSESHQQANTA